jgi:mono/diheme cytochrome c family protein
MREYDLVLSRGPEANGTESRRFLVRRRMVGRFLLATSLLLIVAGFSGGKASAASDTDRSAGAEIFKKTGCEHCHGPDGIGTNRAPSLTTVGKRLKKYQIEHQIREGGKQMPPFNDVLNDEDIRKLVDYLAHKKKAPKTQRDG